MFKIQSKFRSFWYYTASENGFQELGQKVEGVKKN